MRDPYADLTPDQLEATGRSLIAQGELLMELARLKRGGSPANRLTTGHPPATVSDSMTSAQLVNRAHAIAKGVAERSGDELQLAAAHSKWKSLRKYTEARLRVKHSSLSGYATGKRPCPRDVADRIKADLGVDHGYWKKGVV